MWKWQKENLLIVWALRHIEHWFNFFRHLELLENCPHLNSAVEEAAVLPGLIHQAFGERERQHAPRLVGFLQASSGFFEHLRPCLGVRACNWLKKTKTSIIIIVMFHWEGACLCFTQPYRKTEFILDTVFITSLVQMTDLIGRQTNHVIYLLQTWGETCCGWTCWQVGAGALVWPWAPSISSPRTSGAVSWKHGQDQPQGSRSNVLLDIDWQLDNIWGQMEGKRWTVNVQVHHAAGEEWPVNASKVVK